MIGAAVRTRHSFLALSHLPMVMYGTKMNDAKTPKMNPPICEKLSM